MLQLKPQSIKVRKESYIRLTQENLVKFLSTIYLPYIH